MREKRLERILDPGEMDRKVFLYAPIEVRTSSGHSETSFSDTPTYTMRAKKEWSTPKENESDLMEKSLNIITWTTRYYSDVTGKWDLKDSDGKSYEILGYPVEIGRKRYMEIRTLFAE